MISPEIASSAVEPQIHAVTKRLCQLNPHPGEKARRGGAGRVGGRVRVGSLVCPNAPMTLTAYTPKLPIQRPIWGKHGVAKAVFDTKAGSGYDDRIEERYHFSAKRNYLAVGHAAIGDWIVYREPQRNSGRRVCVAAARVTAVEPDPLQPNHAYARIDVPRRGYIVRGRHQRSNRSLTPMGRFRRWNYSHNECRGLRTGSGAGVERLARRHNCPHLRSPFPLTHTNPAV